MPSTFEYRLVEQIGGVDQTVLGAELTLNITGVNRANNKAYTRTIITQQEKVPAIVDGKEEMIAPTQPYVFDFNFLYDSDNNGEIDDHDTELIDIEKITLSASYNGNRVAYEELPFMYGTSEQAAKFSIVANGIYASVQDAGFTFNSSGLKVTNGNISIENADKHEVFRADSQGNLYFEGTINSKDGFISGWTIEDDELIDDSGRVGIHSGERRFYNDIDKSPVRFWAGAPIQESETSLTDLATTYNFAVTEAGTLYATGAEISGAIEATRGRILNTFYVGPNNDTGIVIYGDEKSSYIGSMRYASGALGGGWTINSDGSAEFNNVSVRGKITSSVFEYDHISSIGGSLYVAPTMYTLTDSQRITAKDDQGYYHVTWQLNTSLTEAFGGRALAVNDYLLLDGNVTIGNQIVHVSNVFAIIENSATDGSNNLTSVKTLKVKFQYTSYDENKQEILLNNAYFQPGTTIVFYGTSETRNGLYLTAMGEHAPYLEIYSSAGTTTDTAIPSVRLGNLSGIQDSRFAHVSGGRLDGYGLYSSNAYLRGQLMLPSAGITNQSDIRVNNSPIRIWAGTEPTDDITDANFIVTEDGSLYAKQGTFEGVVRAVNSEFAGNIRAAGILLEYEDISTEDALHDHFYVAYNDGANPSYNNYVLNIDKDGLSIWEGGLQAYSDFANGENTLGANFQSQLAPYKYNSTTKKAFPFLYLIDSGTTEELTSRMVVNKLHSLTFAPKIKTGESTFSVDILSSQLNNGLWFVNETYGTDEPYEDLELRLFGQKNTGITMANKNLILQNKISNGGMYLTSPAGVCISTTDFDTSTYQNNALLVNGNVQITNNVKAELKISAAMVQEAKQDGNTIGLNFIAVS